jgi:hypothetical protein
MILIVPGAAIAGLAGLRSIVIRQRQGKARADELVRAAGMG